MLQHAHAVILLRWVLIVATSYLVLFSRPLGALTPAAALFVAAYLASNIVVTELLPRLRSWAHLEWGLVIVDIAALSLAIMLADGSRHDLFVLYFAVLFLSALSERIGLVVGAALLITVAHLYTVSRYVDLGVLLQQGYMVRIPFLFVVALFFGHLVQQARGRERSAAEAGQRALRVDLISAIGHDLKNPLGVIDSLAELLLDGDAGALSGEQRELVRRIQTSARQTIVLSQNLIDAERVEAGRLVVARRPASLVAVIEDALAVARSASELKGVTLHAAIEEPVPMLAIDAVQMERVVANLLGNAIKFTPSGGEVRLRARRAARAVEITVSDTGPGIPPDELPHVTERHFRGTRTRAIDGSGLGLFIVRAVVEAHGGQLRVASGATHGTTVCVTLPIGRGEDAASEIAVALPVPVPIA